MKQRPTDKISLALTITVLLFLLATIAATLVRPSFLPWLQLVPVFDVFFMAVSVILAVFLAVQSRRLWLLGAVPLFMVIVFFLRNPGVFNFQAQTTTTGLKLLTYNVQQFRNDSAVASGIARGIKSVGADVVCLQEFGLYHKWPDTESVIQDFARQTGYTFYQFQHHKDNIFGLAVLSKFPILSFEKLFMEPGPTNGAGKFIIQLPHCRMALVNLHLESFNLHSKGIPNIAEVIRKQGEQANSVVASLPESEPVAVVGDFNAVRGSAIYHVFSQKLKDSYKTIGKGLGTTMNFWFPLAIDHVFYGGGLAPVSHETLDWKFSDHRPILSEVELERGCIQPDVEN